MTDYAGFERNKILKYVKNSCNSVIKYSDAFLDLSLKKIINNKKYVIPYFMSIGDIDNEK